MTDSGAIKTKRNGTRIFKNPPQPHMCIQDFMQGSELPCYVNVLSWDKVAMHYSLYENVVPLYGGMRVSPPRGEKAEVGVFAVIANPELLKLYGKNCQDVKEKATLIEAILDFVETKNEGVYFSRQYVILKDKDITGELKEVWMAVQAKRERENLLPQQETWIDAQPPTPQYPQYSDQQTQHQQLQSSQQQHVEYAHPPQYRSNAAYPIGPVPGNDIVNHEREIRYNYQQQNPIVTQSEQIYQSFNSQDRCFRLKVPQNQSQQNCPAYPAPQYQFQQLPRQMVPQYVNSNMHINSNPNSNMPNQDNKIIWNFSSKCYDMKGMQQQSTEKSPSNNTMFVPTEYEKLWLADQVLQQQQMQQHQIPRHRVQQQIQQQQLIKQQQQQQQQQLQYCPATEKLRVEQQQHQIQMQHHQIQEHQFINYQQSTNQQYQRQTQQMPQSQNQPQSENQIDIGDKRSKRKNCQYKGEFNKAHYRTRKMESVAGRRRMNKEDLTCRGQWNPNLKKEENQSLDTRLDADKVNQIKGDSTTNTNDQDESYHQAYTILKKPEMTTTTTTTLSGGESNPVPKSSGMENEIEKKLAQISVEDCKDTTEVNVVLS